MDWWAGCTGLPNRWAEPGLRAGGGSTPLTWLGRLEVLPVGARQHQHYAGCINA
jgi:hypothetical protein